MKLNQLTLAISAVIASSVILTGCNDLQGEDGTNLTSNNNDVMFASIPVPSDTATKTSLQTTSKVVVNGQKQTIGYTKLFATGELDSSGETWGAVKDYLDQGITFADGSAYICNGTNSGVGSGLDHISILQKNDKLYMVSQYECQIGSMYMNELKQNSKTGALSVKDGSLQFISQKDDFGGYVHCAGQITPWQSHLGSEEYEPDARSVEANADPVTGLTSNTYYDEVAKFWGNDATKMSPYYYGWTPEVKVTASGNADYAKHYSMGRFAHELAYVMPDKKTVYLSDDGTNGSLFMFIADTAEDLSAGTLYAAKWNQVSADGLGRATLTWVSLGHSTDAAIKAILNPDGNVQTNDAPKFSDIFSTEAPQGDGSCATAGFININTSAGNECLKLKDVNGDTAVDATDEAIAARLESRRMAAYKGATSEFRKKEGITFNARDNKLYVAISEVARGMENNEKNGAANTTYDLGGNNDIKLPYNKCGGVYELNVTKNSTIGSDYVAYDMVGEVAGIATDYSGTALSANSCDVNNISNPDNVTFLEGTDILVIGEDTSKHENNMIWAYNIKDKSLSRILTTPLDAETTSPFWHKNINGFGYLTAVTQHPMDGQAGATAAEKESQAGVMGPFDFTTIR
ncbi:DUF839 domain-containing protein [Hydrogenovibrio sp. 3SP14C1]|uniref:alkaline phosphatase PhoX n=1 Tax=Hydrogenovibrio sp. 3SP14C1 TaxID=3038774 RepID=UPI002416D3BE|nr:alkaline phosphatase PhoX [Hydrogenovibrio sp. 3SP14C1]MDG4813484.1 DUF839 domain-containing protein [Hydrogenovibrio sp. 3SP14C1]